MSNDRPTNLSAADALARLRVGNRRYVDGNTSGARRDASRRADLVGGQAPFATVLTCADSRVSPELVFDEGLGDLFVIRVAGNIADDTVLGSIEYAALHLGVNLVAVMGHQSCGAVAAAVDNIDFDGPATHSHIDSLIDAIRPSVAAARAEGEQNLLDRSVRSNAAHVAAGIAASEPVMAGLTSDGSEVVPAYYNLATGAVEF